jgi:amino acid adenylation domain-containing protein
MSSTPPKECLIKSETDLLREHWITTIGKADEAAGVPSDANDMKCASGGARVPINTEKVISCRLLEIAGESILLQYAIFVSAIAVCLFRYTNKHVVVIGSPSRKDPTNVHPKSTAVPVIITLGHETTFRELLQSVRETLMEAYKRQPYSLEQPQGDPGTAPQTYLPSFRVAARLDALHEVMPDVGQDIVVELFRSSTEFSGLIAFNRANHSSDIVKRFWSHVSHVLSWGLREPDCVIYNLPMLSAPEREQIIVDWNRTGESRAEDLNWQELFEEQVEKRGDATAIVWGTKKISYQELNGQANQLAWHLRKLGAGPEVRVASCIARSVEAVIGILGILKAGATYVPIDQEYPVERLKFMMNDSGTSILLTRGKVPECVKGEAVRVLDISDEAEEIGRQSRENFPITVVSQNASYVMYTSGSTGKPKGCANTYGGLSNLALAQRQILSLTHEDRVLQFASLNFDASIWECLMALVSGAQLVIGGAINDSATELAELFSESRVSIATLPPSVLRFVSDEATSGLRTLIVAGEACSTELVRQWSRGRRMLNAYGPTEAAVCVTVSSPLNANGDCPMGRPIANTQIYILDEHLEPLPIGVQGELYIGGEGVARGYINRPELTAEHFIPNVFSQKAGERLYRTGDIGKWRSDGNIEFVCRKDQQIKLRGHRIELREIEAVLERHPGVQQSVVVLLESAGERKLVACVVKKDRMDKMEKDELQIYLRTKLPEHMIPPTFAFIRAFPTTPNGKVDRRALLASAEGLCERVKTVTASARTKVEETLCEIWKQVLGLERVSTEDNFFEIGGHSLRATQVVSKVRRVFGIELPVRRIFETPTISKLAITVEASRASQKAGGQ